MPDEQERPYTYTDQVQGRIMALLLDPRGHRPWSVKELMRELGKPDDVGDAVAALQAAGLIHCTNDCLVFPTRAAVRFDQITL